jgi:hypothetical protein
MIKHWQNGLAATGTLLLIALMPARAEEPSGVLWQVTSQMEMAGMPMSMPAQTAKVCTAKEWKKPPPGGDKSCANTNFQRVGNKATWDMQCSGQMPMKGKGEITFDGTDSYTGMIEATAEGMTVKINLSGKKLGTCDKPVD